MKAIVDRQELEAFLNYLADKAEDVYEREVARAVERFMKEQVTTISGDIIK